MVTCMSEQFMHSKDLLLLAKSEYTVKPSPSSAGEAFMQMFDDDSEIVSAPKSKHTVAAKHQQEVLEGRESPATLRSNAKEPIVTETIVTTSKR